MSSVNALKTQIINKIVYDTIEYCEKENFNLLIPLKEKKYGETLYRFDWKANNTSKV